MAWDLQTTTTGIYGEVGGDVSFDDEDHVAAANDDYDYEYDYDDLIMTMMIVLLMTMIDNIDHDQMVSLITWISTRIIVKSRTVSKRSYNDNQSI